LFGGSAARLFGGSAVRLFGGLAGRRFGGSAVRWNFSAKLGSKMEPSWNQVGTKLAASWDQVGSKLRPRVAKMLPRWPAWSVCSFFWSEKYENNQQSITFA
jgi:hypothetical protein